MVEKLTSLYGRKINRPKHFQDFFLENEKESKYPMRNHVSYHRIDKNHKHYLKQITIHNESNSFSEVPKDPN